MFPLRGAGGENQVGPWSRPARKRRKGSLPMGSSTPTSAKNPSSLKKERGYFTYTPICEGKKEEKRNFPPLKEKLKRQGREKEKNHLFPRERNASSYLSWGGDYAPEGGGHLHWLAATQPIRGGGEPPERGGSAHDPFSIRERRKGEEASM